MIHMFMLAIQDTFLESFSCLPKGEQKRTREMLRKLREDTTTISLNFERYREALDPRIHSIRLNDTYRAIVLKPDEGDTLLLLWIDHHDDAYRWAKRKKFRIHPQNNTIQMWALQENEVIDTNTTQVYSLFSSFTNRQLMDLGIPEEQIPQVKQILTLEELDQRREDFPADAYEALQYLASGESYEEVYRFMQELDLEQKNTNHDHPWQDAIQHPANSRQIVVVTDDEQLNEILDKPLEKWRIFLHPSQKLLVEKDYGGPVRVLGGAGTGKTVVALHRTRRLIRKYKSDQRILVTTFTNNLADYLQDCLASMCQPEELKRIDVLSIDRLARTIIEDSDRSEYKIIWEPKELIPLWEKAIQKIGYPKEKSLFVMQEYKYVIQMQSIDSFKAYESAARTGRGKRISNEEKKKIWAVIDDFRKQMKQNRWLDPIDVLVEARLWMENHPGKIQYRCAVIDEGQDFHPEAFRLLRALVSKGENDLFVVGDTHQRIYDRHVVLSRCGIDVRGRSKRLRINYRTTEQIREHAMKRLSGFQFDDLDGGEYHGKDTSLIYGEAPERHHFATEIEEKVYIVTKIRELLKLGIHPNEIAILARKNKLVDQIKDYLMEENIPAVLMKNRYMQTECGVNCGTMHRSKGLEFRVVFLIHVNEDIIPPVSIVNDLDVDERMRIEKKERSLLYVASTRARDQLYVTSCGSPSKLWEMSTEELSSVISHSVS